MVRVKRGREESVVDHPVEAKSMDPTDMEGLAEHLRQRRVQSSYLVDKEIENLKELPVNDLVQEGVAELVWNDAIRAMTPREHGEFMKACGFDVEYTEELDKDTYEHLKRFHPEVLERRSDIFYVEG